MIDEILERQLSEIDSDEVAVLLSGGVDSSTLAFTAARLGKRVHGYSFYVGEPSYDSLKAEEICNTFGFDFTGVDVSTNSIIEDFKTLAYTYSCKKKTQFECTFPFMYIFPLIKEKYVLSGVAADGHYGLSKKAMIHFRHTKDKFDDFRKDYFSSENPAGIRQLEMLSEEYDKILIAPYLTSEVYDYFNQFTWEEINKPYEKHLIRSRFSEFEQVKVKKHLNLQLVGGVDKVFETLLESSEINFKNRIRVMDICRDWHEKTQQSDLSALLS